MNLTGLLCVMSVATQPNGIRSSSKVSGRYPRRKSRTLAPENTAPLESATSLTPVTVLTSNPRAIRSISSTGMPAA